MLEFKDNKITTETVKNICSVYGQGIITEHQVWNWFSKFHCGNPGHSSDFNQDALRELGEYTIMEKFLRIST